MSHDWSRRWRRSRHRSVGHNRWTWCPDIKLNDIFTDGNFIAMLKAGTPPEQVAMLAQAASA